MASVSENTSIQPVGPVRWVLPVLLLGSLAVLSICTITHRHLRLPVGIPITAFTIIACAVWYVAARRVDCWWPKLRQRLEDHTDSLDELPVKQLGWWIALASGGALFAELVLIRWHASMFQLFAYYKNVSLLAAFLGLGIGYAYGRRRPVFTPFVLPAFALHFFTMYLLRHTPLQLHLQSPIAEDLHLGLGQISGTKHTAICYSMLVLVFTFTMLTCIPLGHLAARLMLRRPPLIAYGCNLLGSLGGIALFSVLCWGWCPPAIWILATGLCIIPFLMFRQGLSLALPSMGCVGAVLALLALPLRVDEIDVYTPYQVISATLDREKPPTFQVNNVYYQHIVDLRSERVKNDAALQLWAQHYELPFRLKDKLDDVLIVGSGTGNDVASALRCQVGHVDAVEIDPAILAFGQKLHPEAPYQDSRVTAINEDARTYMRNTDRKYDLIVYGLLDSHTLLSGRAGVRLDSFVYTVEAFREARARLKPDGMIAMTFCVLGNAQGKKFFTMLEEAFDGEQPRVFSGGCYGPTFVIGPGAPRGGVTPAAPELTASFLDPTIRADVSTDDWPFLYMPVRTYPLSYLVAVGTLLLVSVLCLRQLAPVTRANFSAPCFFLGAGFMLVETRSITELGLLFGNTWHVISVVIASILIMSFLANWVCVRLGTLHPIIAFTLLIGSLVLGLEYAGSAFAGVPPMAAQYLAVGLVALPLFFSGLVFSGELQRSGNLPAALASNLFGAMLGGFCEYNSMYFGFRSLYVFALAFYGMGFAAILWRMAVQGRVSRQGESSGAVGEERQAA